MELLSNRVINNTITSKTKKNILLGLVLLVISIELIRTAWISDDAAITLRSILNFIHGYGPNFNVGERVQAYTHPLWFLLLSIVSFIIRNIFVATLLVSITISLITLSFFILKLARNFWLGILSIFLLSISKAYVDYSTSGLENPLSHLILLFGIYFGIKIFHQSSFKSLLYFFLCCSCLYLNRPDLILIFLPMICCIVIINRKTPKQLLKTILIAIIPIIIWILFSLYYYGFPFPNTAYAKLGTGIELNERIAQGLKYFLDSYERDPITLFLIAVGLILGVFQSLFTRTLTIGVILYLIYIISIGGDFMSGRFFTSPLLVAVVMISLSSTYYIVYCLIIFFSLFFGIARLDYTLFSGRDYSVTFLNEYKIADERGYYFQSTGLLNLTGGVLSLNTPEWKLSGRSVSIICGQLGFTGLLAGPSRHFIDNCALTDPLLARLPAKYNKNWRIGHFYRQLPDGYLESVQKQQNLIKDPDTKNFYDVISLITQGDLNSIDRFKSIVKINTNRSIIKNTDKYRYQEIIYSPYQVDYSQLNHQIVEDGAWDKKGNIIFIKTLLIQLPHEMNIYSLDFSVGNTDYKVEYLLDSQVVSTTDIKSKDKVFGMVHHKILKRVDSKVDAIRITGIDKKAYHLIAEGLSKEVYYSLGYMIIN